MAMQNSSRILVLGGDFAFELLFCSEVINLAGGYTYTTKTDLGVTDPHEQDPKDLHGNQWCNCEVDTTKEMLPRMHRLADSQPL